MEELFSERNSLMKGINNNEYPKTFRLSIATTLFNQYSESDEREALRILRELMDLFGIEQPICAIDSVLLREFKEEIFTFMENCPWNQLFDFIEQALAIGIKDEAACIDKYNNIFRYNGCKYKILNKIIIPVMTDLEMEEISKAMNTGIDSVDTAYNNALKLFSDKVTPDYKAVIAKASNALESMIIKIAKDNGSSEKTLGRALTDIKAKGVYIDTDMEELAKKIYKYVCSEGIRHGGATSIITTESDARLILVLSATLINYLNTIR